MPYLIVGAGLIRYRMDRFSYNEWFVSGGLGTRIYFKPNWYVAPELRIGWEPHIRLTGSMGTSFVDRVRFTRAGKGSGRTPESEDH